MCFFLSNKICEFGTFIENNFCPSGVFQDDEKVEYFSSQSHAGEWRSSRTCSLTGLSFLPGPSIATKIFGDVVIRIENWDIDTQSPIA